MSVDNLFSVWTHKSLLILLIMWPVYAQSQESSPPPIQPQIHTKHTKQKTQDDKRGTEESPVVIKVIPPIVKSEEAENIKRERKEKSETDWWLVKFTGALAFIAVLQLIVFGLQARRLRQTFKVTGKAADAAKQAADDLLKAERAYVFITIISKEIKPSCEKYQGSDGFLNFCAELQIWNYGKTPAEICKIFVDLFLDAPIIPKTERTETPKGITLGSHDSAPIPLSKIINAGQEDNIRRRNIIPYCCGMIEYRDMFGKEQYIKFCWEYTLAGIETIGKWNASPKYPELNKRT